MPPSRANTHTADGSATGMTLLEKLMTNNIAMQSMEEQMSNKVLLFGLAAAGIALLIASDPVIAGAGGAEFDDVWTQLKDWTQGTLGRIASGGIVIVGVIMGIARQSLMPFATGVGGAMGLYNSPTVIESIMSATLAHVPTATQAVITLTNGLQ